MAVLRMGGSRFESVRPAQSASQRVQESMASNRPTQTASQRVQKSMSSVKPTQSAAEKVQDSFATARPAQTAHDRVQSSLASARPTVSAAGRVEATMQEARPKPPVVTPSYLDRPSNTVTSPAVTSSMAGQQVKSLATDLMPDRAMPNVGEQAAASGTASEYARLDSDGLGRRSRAAVTPSPGLGISDADLHTPGGRSAADPNYRPTAAAPDPAKTGLAGSDLKLPDITVDYRGQTRGQTGSESIAYGTDIQAGDMGYQSQSIIGPDSRYKKSTDVSGPVGTHWNVTEHDKERRR